MIFDAFVSDPHFGHKNILRFSKRPFSSVEEQTEEMIRRYNARIGTGDRVLWMGDCFFCGAKEATDILSRLNGEKHLVLGNHDEKPRLMLARGFQSVTHKIHTKIEGRNVVMIHYDQWELRSPWDNKYRDRRHPLDMNNFEVIIHGHTHQKTPVLLNQVHVGVDSWDYAPVRHDEIASVIRRLPSSWTKGMREEYELLTRYHNLIRLIGSDPQSYGQAMGSIEDAQEELLSLRYDPFRGLGWENERVTVNAVIP